MKIAVFLENYYCGGIDTFVLNLVNHWPEAADELTVVANSMCNSSLPRLVSGISGRHRVVAYDIVPFQSFFNRPFSRPSFMLRLAQAFFKAASPVMRYAFLVYNVVSLRLFWAVSGFDRLIIVNGGYPGGDTCRAATISWGMWSGKPPAVHSVHGIAVRPGWHIALQERAVSSLVSRHTKYFVCVSNAVSGLLSGIPGIRPGGHICIHNGIAPDRAPAAAGMRLSLMDRYAIPPDARLCLMLAAYHRHKNFDKGHGFMVKAFRRIVDKCPAAHLLMCGYGTGDDMDRVREMVRAEKLDRNVHVESFRTDAGDLLKSCDILLAASLTFESFGLICIEAMARRVPVVATSVGGIPEVVADGEGGWCVPPGDIDAYTDRVVTLLSDAELRRSVGERGYRRYLDKFTADRMARQYASLVHGTYG